MSIYPSKELASLIGNSFGDGQSTQRFKYVNKRKELINKIKKNAKFLFHCRFREFFIEEKQCYGIEYPGIVGQILNLVGTPLGRKTSVEFYVPSWIMNGSNRIKTAFLRAMFDDEGGVCKGRQWFISFSQYKNTKLIESHKKYLEQIRQLLFEFRIHATKISFKKNYKNTKEFGFRIGGYKNLYKFLQIISSSHIPKRQKLRSMVNDYYLRKDDEI